jgi:effector-binding domain-containing protein
MRTIDGIPFLRLFGSYFEMGEQYGSLLKGLLAEGRKYLSSRQWERVKRKKDLLAALEKQLSPKDAQYLEGMAAGSGLDYLELVFDAYGGAIAFPWLGCTSILTTVENAEGKRILAHGKNLDNSLQTGRGQAVIEFNPDGEIKYVVLEVVGSGIADGMNERGISVSIDDGGQGLKGDYPQHRPITFLMRDILSSASSLAEVDRRIEGYVSDVGEILAVGSGTEGDGAVYDISYDKIKKNPRQGSRGLFVTNTFLSPDLTPPMDLLQDPRYAILTLSMGAVRTIDDLIRVMSDPGEDYGVNNMRTKHSIIYDLEDKSIYLACGDRYAAWGEWLRYDWLSDRVAAVRDPYGVSGPPRLIETSAQRVVSIRSTLPSYDAQPQLWSELDSYIEKESLTVSGSGFSVHPGHKGGGFDVEVVQPIAESRSASRDGPGRVRFGTSKPTAMVCVDQRGPYATLRMAYAAIDMWLASNGYRANGPYEECYVKGDWNDPDPKDWETQVRVPVIKKLFWR